MLYYFDVFPLCKTNNGLVYSSLESVTNESVYYYVSYSHFNLVYNRYAFKFTPSDVRIVDLVSEELDMLGALKYYLITPPMSFVVVWLVLSCLLFSSVFFQALQ